MKDKKSAQTRRIGITKLHKFNKTRTMNPDASQGRQLAQPNSLHLRHDTAWPGYCYCNGPSQAFLREE